VHLERVFVFLSLFVPVVEFPRFMQLFDGRGVDSQVAERGGVEGVLGEGTAGEIEGVGGAEEEDALRGAGEGEGCVGPGGGGAGVGVACVSETVLLVGGAMRRGGDRRCDDDPCPWNGKLFAVD
jgi:hypothetical protein